ncbi:hypothetical protein [Acidithiobacillus ferrianus]|uniref:hypothetical protein n=1 Tax=Acidithiobacillus ferrianus TaxID=2678518 RepID=UPI0034E4A418
MVRIEVWIPAGVMENLARQSLAEGSSPGTLAGHLLAAALCPFLLDLGWLSLGEVITLHAFAGLDTEGKTCFAITLPH